MRTNVIEADALKPKKHHNLTSLVTLFTYMLQNNSKWADERHQNKVYRPLRLFFAFGHARVASLANFLFSPSFTWEPVRRLMLGRYTGENLQVTQFLYALSILANMNFQTKNRFRVYRKLITWPTIAKRLLFLKENSVIKECLTFFSQPLPAQPSVSGPMVSFLAALAEMAALA